MDPLVLDFDESQAHLTITGDTQAIWQNRRLSIFLRDYQRASYAAMGPIRLPATRELLGPHVKQVEDVLRRHGFEVARSELLSKWIAAFVSEEQKFVEFSDRARAIWENDVPPPEFARFVGVLSKELPQRRLYPLQLLAAYHLAFAQNAANFSVPGAGKTSVVYGAFAYLRSLPPADSKHVNKILVVGPLSSFGPWETEFEACFGRKALSHRLSGGVSSETRRRVLYSELPEYRDAELVLVSYPAIASDTKHVQHFLTRAGNRVMVVLDEAHKIKNSEGGVWADASLAIAPEAAARVVLTGTPAPNGYEDLSNLFRFIWPTHDVIRFRLHHLREMTQNPFDQRTEALIDNIAPFFIRIRKSDLHLPSPIEHAPASIAMGPRQERIYRFIEERYVQYFQSGSRESWVRDTLTKARLIRLMQAATNPALLSKPLQQSGESAGAESPLLLDDTEILSQITTYEAQELSTKLVAAADLVSDILGRSPPQKVVVWCVFIDNLFALQGLLEKRGIESRILYGGTPTGVDIDDDQLDTREAIIREFNEPTSGYRVIIANPFAVGESISLHKACRHAIYLERNFNAAAFLQSKDRIHRYGLPQDAEVNYYYLCARASVDETIHRRLLEKEAAMNRIMESRAIPLLNMNLESGEDDEVDDIAAIIKDYGQRHTDQR